jgi:decaprenylphospho-beta-D-erythro-pentofuranosid-2-ulose 2-reductase
MKVVSFGSNSAIARSVCLEILKENPGSEFYLFGRNYDAMLAFKDNLQKNSAGNCEIFEVNFVDSQIEKSTLDYIYDKSIDITILSYGVLGDENMLRSDFDMLREFIYLNLTSKLILLSQVSQKIEKFRDSTLVVISSVAGDRGRRSNYIYGSMNAALTEFLSGLRAKLSSKNINVLTVKPGLISTPMTKNFKKSILWSSPEKIAPIIYKAILKKRSVIYVPRFWGLIMRVILLIPEKIFKKINF